MNRRIHKINRVLIQPGKVFCVLTASIEWTDTNGRNGITCGVAHNAHMAALIARAEREGAEIKRYKC